MTRRRRPLPPLRVPAFVRYLDLVVLLLALPLFLLADLPLAAYLVGGGAWVLQRIVQLLLQRRAEASDDPRMVAGCTAGSMIARGWFCALAIFGVGLAEGDEAGLSAALLVIALFTVYFTVRMILRPIERGEHDDRGHRSRSPSARRPEPANQDPDRRRALPRARDPARRAARQRGQERGVQAPERVQARQLDLAPDRARRHEHQQGGAVPVPRLALTIVAWVYIANRMQARPNRVQTAVETLYQFMKSNIAEGNMDRRMAAKWFTFVGTLFLFIWFSNLIGYIPLPTNTEHKVNVFGVELPSFAIYAATANISVPLA